jgi:hypothetical protein
MSRHPVAIVLITLIGLAISSCTGVSVAGGLGYQPPVIPVKFSVTFAVRPDGSISVAGGVGLVTDIGTFSAEVNFDEHTQPAPDETLLVIRHRSNDGLVDSVFRIATGEEVTVKLNGRTVVHVSNRKILIDASKGQVMHVTITNAGSLQGPVNNSNSQPTESAEVTSRPTTPSAATFLHTHVLLICDTRQTSSYANDGSDCTSGNMYSGDSIALEVIGLTQDVVNALCRQGYNDEWTSRGSQDYSGTSGMCGLLNANMLPTGSDGYLEEEFSNPDELGTDTVTWRLISPTGKIVLEAGYSFRVLETLLHPLSTPPS